jgi:hypothetical protein
VDAHSLIQPDYVERLVGLLQRGGWGGVGGRKVAVGGPPSGDVIAAVLGSRAGVGGSTYHYATAGHVTDHVPFGVYDTELARELSGWDERLVANEDFEFDARLRRAGRQLYLEPSVTVTWQCRSRIPDLFRQYLRYGRGKADVALLHPGELRPRHLAPPALVAAAVVAAAVAARSPRPLAALGASYAAGLLGLAAPIAVRLRSPAAALKVPVALAAMQVGWGIGFWLGVLRLARRGFTLPELSQLEGARWDSPQWQPSLGAAGS